MTSKGVLIFASNNETIDYHYLAERAARQVERHLDVPVEIVDVRGGDQKDGSTWHNHSRYTAWELSPFDQTLVMDADYLVFSDRLASLWDNPNGFLIGRGAYDMMGMDELAGDKWLGHSKMPMRWATLMWFDRSDYAGHVFQVVEMLRENWSYYSALFGFRMKPWRNDYAFTVALHLLGAYGTSSQRLIPWSIPTLTKAGRVAEIREDGVLYSWSREGKSFQEFSGPQDVHVLNKESLIAAWKIKESMTPGRV